MNSYGPRLLRTSARIQSKGSWASSPRQRSHPAIFDSAFSDGFRFNGDQFNAWTRQQFVSVEATVGEYEPAELGGKTTSSQMVSLGKFCDSVDGRAHLLSARRYRRALCHSRRSKPGTSWKPAASNDAATRDRAPFRTAKIVVCSS